LHEATSILTKVAGVEHRALRKVLDRKKFGLGWSSAVPGTWEALGFITSTTKKRNPETQNKQ
jgi:hypothetical protein